MDLREAGSTFDLDIRRFAEAGEYTKRYVGAIASAVEHQRSALRTHAVWGELICRLPRGFSSKFDVYEPLIDRLSWYAVFTIDDTPKIAAKIAGDSNCGAVIAFAKLICPLDAIAGIHASYSYLSAIRYLSPILQEFKRTSDRIKTGAKRGGQKGGQAKRDDSKRPSNEELMATMNVLLQTGHVRRDVAGILAMRWRVSPHTVRRWLKSAEAESKA